jgi:exopolysaccharide production protein ExoQ
VLVLFCVIGLLSALWSITPLVSLYKWSVLALATLVGSYLGFRFQDRGFSEVVFWYAAVVVMLSALTALAVPLAGRMLFPPYDGAWRGIFWHKNHLGTLAALLSVLLLYRIAEDGRQRRRMVLVDGLVYASCVALVLLSRSATGLLVMVAGAMMAALAGIWQRVRGMLHRKHYVLGFALAAVALILIATQAPRFLALLGKDATLTGRIPMWQLVLRDFVSQRLLLGHGLGAFWNLEANRLAVQRAAGWGSPVAIGDNGWLDVLLGLGVLGLAVFVVLLARMLWRSIKRAQLGRSFLETQPLVFLLTALLANVAFSLFFETESAVWLILVALQFLPAPRAARAG